MKIMVITLLAVFWAAFAPANAAVSIGAEAPEFTLLGSDSKEHKLSDYKEGVVVLEWFNHQCPFVRKQYDSGNMQSLQKKFAEKGVKWFSVISSAPGKQGHVTPEGAAENLAADAAHPTAVLIDEDGAVGRTYGAKNTPHMFVIKDGKLVYQGAIDSIPSASEADIAKAENYVERALEEVLGGKKVSMPVTTPYGCSVKY